MEFRSILFFESQNLAAGEVPAPNHFHDLNLDQILHAVTDGRKEYQLDGYFHRPLTDLDAIAYRHEVMKALEDRSTRDAVDGFAGAMRAMRQHLLAAKKRRDPIPRERWHLGAVELYCTAVEQLDQALRPLDLPARGLRAFREYLESYVASPGFAGLAAEARRVRASLAAVRYGLKVLGSTITVCEASPAKDLGAEIERTFARFRRAAVRDYRMAVDEGAPDLNHVDAQVLECVTKLNPLPFGDLHAFFEAHAEFQEMRLVRFDREVQFYTAWLDHVGKLREVGLEFCYPALSDSRKEVVVRRTFDLALAGRLVAEKAEIVRNDCVLRGEERILVITGPNQGGKTTFARTLGQLHYLASLGCTVPGSEARLFLCDRIFTHFEREEDPRTAQGKLHDDLVRIRCILDEATPRSLVILNEIFASTTLDDAVFLGQRILARLSRLDLLVVCVTFLCELASFDEKTISMVGTVDPHDPTVRTFKLVRGPPDGLAYALAIAEKHRVTSRWLFRRLQS